eukprot:TRINITY_DN8027_c0_g1_i1.p2 TRINITY_DN8027_c0_g1~~TRINITY_DN8027_c0_g1_i1.p2  ORF type:complete len:139 (-),score=3.53 TRINITY_DN8027_c0_g1_i1:84-500(-)
MVLEANGLLACLIVFRHSAHAVWELGVHVFCTARIMTLRKEFRIPAVVMAQLTINYFQCLAWYCLSCFGVQGILQCVNRTSMREKYGIEGSSFGDFCSSCCCTCCTLIQENKEIKVRVTGINPKTQQPYSSPNQMSYP